MDLEWEPIEPSNLDAFKEKYSVKTGKICSNPYEIDDLLGIRFIKSDSFIVDTAMAWTVETAGEILYHSTLYLDGKAIELNAQISQAEKGIKDVYTEIGKFLMEQFPETVKEKFPEQLGKIDGFKETIAKAKDAIAALAKKAEDKVEAAAEEVKETAAEVVEAAGEKVEEVKEAVAERIDEIK